MQNTPEINLAQGLSASVLVTFGTGQVFVVGARRQVMECLATSLISAH